MDVVSTKVCAVSLNHLSLDISEIFSYEHKLLWYRLVMINIDLSETAHFGHCLHRRNSDPVATLPHTAVVFLMQPFDSRKVKK